MRVLPRAGHEAVGLDRKPSPFTHCVGSIIDRAFVATCLTGVDAVVHAATLHKPHVATHSRQAFIDTNVTGTLNLLEEARACGVDAFVFTSTTSAFGAALAGDPGAAAAWITEDVAPVPKNIYGVTKVAAEDLCELFHRRFGLSCLILRTARFFPEPDDRRDIRQAYADANAKVNEFLYRRADLSDIVDAHVLALDNVRAIGFGRYILSATTAFTRDDVADLGIDAPAVVRLRVPRYATVYERLGWSMFPRIDRVYDNGRARRDLGWTPKYDFAHILDLLEDGAAASSPLAATVGIKGYHDEVFADGPYPVE